MKLSANYALEVATKMTEIALQTGRIADDVDPKKSAENLCTYYLTIAETLTATTEK